MTSCLVVVLLLGSTACSGNDEPTRASAARTATSPETAESGATPSTEAGGSSTVIDNDAATTAVGIDGDLLARRLALLGGTFPANQLNPLIEAVESRKDWYGEISGATIREAGEFFLCTAVDEERPPSCGIGVTMSAPDEYLKGLPLKDSGSAVVSLTGWFRHASIVFEPDQ